MGCPLKHLDGAETIVGYVAGGLAPHVASEFQRHLRSCVNCRDAVAAQQEVWRALDAWRAVAVSPDFDRRLFRRIAEEEHCRWWATIHYPQWLWRPAIPFAAAFALIAGAFLLQGPTRQPGELAQLRSKLNQVRHALDDMDLLTQLGVEPVAEQPSPSKKI